MAKLTDVRAKKLAPQGKSLPDGTVTGLRLHPGREKGRGKWLMRFVSPETNKRRDMGFGTYPEVPISEARKAALDARELITNVYTPEYKEIVLKDNRIVKARVYISNVSHKHYVGNISENEKVNFLRQGIGSEGRSIEYLKNIIEQLSKLEIVDQGLIHLLQLCNKP